MRVWVDADACPGVIKDILYRAAERAGFPLILVANRALQVPRSPWIRMIQVSRGFDVADNHIVADSSPGDLVITADIPLAAAVVGKAVSALNPRGELYTPDNVQGLLDMRNFMDSLR
ncbi:MAG: YaiI/YqxD family protein, partial [Burkholderiales bacterium]|nr:YaiI/YqxD family protein [Burkholderiales bacterium]